MLVLATLPIIGSIDVGKTKHMQRLCQVQKNIRGHPVRMSKRLEKVL